jgi:hypothetical protein
LRKGRGENKRATHGQARLQLNEFQLSHLVVAGCVIVNVEDVFRVTVGPVMYAVDVIVSVVA